MFRERTVRTAGTCAARAPRPSTSPSGDRGKGRKARGFWEMGSFALGHAAGAPCGAGSAGSVGDFAAIRATSIRGRNSRRQSQNLLLQMLQVRDPLAAKQ